MEWATMRQLSNLYLVNHIYMIHVYMVHVFEMKIEKLSSEFTKVFKLNKLLHPSNTCNPVSYQWQYKTLIIMSALISMLIWFHYNILHVLFALQLPSMYTSLIIHVYFVTFNPNIKTSEGYMYLCSIVFLLHIG